jgi:uncharacterized Zn finger protein
MTARAPPGAEPRSIDSWTKELAMSWYGGWRPYVSVAQRRRQARSEMAALRKKGMKIEPVEIEGRTIAHTFWGEAWCEHLESFSDYENRLPRGRTYVRNGSVCHLAISRGRIEAKVVGQEVYNLTIGIKTLPKKKWEAVKNRCAGQIGSLIELLQGNLSDHVMEVVTDREQGLFPLPGEISFDCDCPDWAVMCKHVAAALYGVGARLDNKPELLFELRGVNHEDLIAADAEAAVSQATRAGKSRRLAADNLADVFGIELDAAEPAGTSAAAAKSAKSAESAKSANKRPAAKTTAKKKPAAKKRPQRKKKIARKTAKLAKKTATRKSSKTAKATAKRTG